MSTSYFVVELEQDSYGSAIIPLPDELCHDMALQPGTEFDVEVEDDVITLRRLQTGYEIEDNWLTTYYEHIESIRFRRNAQSCCEPWIHGHSRHYAH